MKFIRGLDNAGKTTIVKKFNGEDIDTISPTLGFAIKTLEHRGLVHGVYVAFSQFNFKLNSSTTHSHKAVLLCMLLV